MKDAAALFTPLTMGSLHLKNRLVMAPLTRLRAEDDGVPNELHALYYEQRASLGLIVAEGTWPTLEGRTWYGQSGICTEAQLEGWKKVTEAVHAKGGLIVLQLMHGGRVSHPEITQTGRTVSASSEQLDGFARTKKGKVVPPPPYALTEAEIATIISEFAQAAKNAIEVGMDGVQLHAANGYLLHQFFAPSSNKRTDHYGGSPVKRAQFPIEVTKAVVDAIGADKVGVRLSPQHNVQGALEPDLEETRATYLEYARFAAEADLAFLDVIYGDPTSELVAGIRKAFGGPFILNNGFDRVTTREEALEIVEGDCADAVSVGRAALANPDLARRWQEGLPVNEPVQSTFYAKGELGYTDYPFYEG